MDESLGLGGLLGWFTNPLATDSSAGLNGLGLLGATFKDIGATQEGGQGSALANFANQQQRAWTYQKAEAVPSSTAPPASIPATGSDKDGGAWNWLTNPIHANSAAGLNGLGLLGATFNDIGAAQMGRQGGALDNFGRRLSSGTAYEAFLRHPSPPR